MKNVLCDKCGNLVVEAATGSKIRNSSVFFCSKKCWRQSNPPPKSLNNDPPDFLKGLFGMK